MNQSLDHLRKLAELRTTLEVFGVRALVQKRLPKAVLEEAFMSYIVPARKAAHNRDYARFGELDQQLHATIVGMADVPMLPKLWWDVWKALSQFHSTTLAQHWPDLRVLSEEHEYLVNTILSGDELAAADGVRSHLQAVWYRLAEKRGDFSKEEDPLQRATAYLCFHYHRPVTLATVAAKVAFVSPGHLSKLFLQRYGKSFRAYLQDVRMAQAAELLRGSALPVGMVAKRCGYRDASRFGVHFRRKYGKGPLHWRKG